MKRLFVMFATMFTMGISGSSGALAEDNVFQKIGKDVSEAGKQIGKTGKHVGKEIGKTGKKVGQGVAKSAREVGRAVSGE